MSEQLDQSTIREVKLLERRLHQLEMQVRAALAEQTLDALDDVEVKYLHPDDAPQSGWVLTWDPTVSTPYGGLARFAPSVAGDIAVSEALASYDDDGAFDETSPYEWETPGFIVAPYSYQLVLVTVDVAVSDTMLGGVTSTGSGSGVGFDVGFPTPWKVEVYDTAVPGNASLGNGSGSCGCTVPLWLHNDTDTEAGLTVSVYASGVSTSFTSDGFDATIDARAESVFQMAALTP